MGAIPPTSFFADKAAEQLHRRIELRAQQNAMAAQAERQYGERFAGLDEQGRVILWRATPIPTVRRGGGA